MVELSRRIPSRLRLRGMTTKYLLRRAMADRLPAGVVNGKKRGFNVPMPSWLAGGLRDFTRDVLSPQRLRRQGLFRPAAVERLVSDHLARRLDHSRAIWTLLVLSVWQDEMLRDIPPVAQRVAAASV
jgi:asparagine synthase (glutamine-hydrolysing)